MNCMRQNTTPNQDPKELMYKAHSCHFEDVERAVNYSIATLFPKTSPVLEETMCYAEPEDVKENSCSADAKQGSGNCQAYRTFCPTVACSPTWINNERFAKFTPNGGLVRENSESNDGNDVLAGHSVMISPIVGSGNFTRDLNKEKYVFNASTSVSTNSRFYECVEIVPFPEDTWANTLKSDASRAAVFFSSLLLGVVVGVIAAACYIRRRELKRGGLTRHQHQHPDYEKFFDQGNDNNNHQNGGDGSTLKTKPRLGEREGVIRTGYADV